ncbi:hypothetical protein B0H66DRAFT_613747 [Apodospora peruviana]|uniref:Uncharacterized protein n=1 Tax=Apodospora peruviana TaxID=516989 RepID=A0AAE0MG72_9PEZI|nr:hypothetical protein B0H66DRAFT_613747 [Apodospora peruviana]
MGGFVSHVHDCSLSAGAGCSCGRKQDINNNGSGMPGSNIGDTTISSITSSQPNKGICCPPAALNADKDLLMTRIRKRIFCRSDTKPHLWEESLEDLKCRFGREPDGNSASEERYLDFPFAVDSAQLCVLLSNWIIKELPSICEKGISDKSKEDIVVKLFALLQVVQLLVQLTTRKVAGLHITQLEVAVLSFAVCTFLIYLLWLEKPKDVNVPMDIYAYHAPEEPEDEQLYLLGVMSHGFFENAFDVGFENLRTSRLNDAINVEAILGNMPVMDWNISSEEIGFAIGSIAFFAPVIALFGIFRFLRW